MHAAALVVAGIDVELHTYTAGRHTERACAVFPDQGLAGGQHLALLLHGGGLVGLGDVDIDVVVGRVVVTGRTYHLGHTLGSGKAIAARDHASPGRRRTARRRTCAFFINHRYIELRLDGRLLNLQRGRCPNHVALGVLPGAAHDDSEADDASRHHVAATQVRQLLVLQFNGFQRLGVAWQAGSQAGHGQPQ
ncbi:hypothetical protein D3C79_863650 [compost metagenome]